MGNVASWFVFKTGKDKFKNPPTSDLWGILVKDLDGNDRILKEFLPNKKAFIFVNVASS